MVDPNEPVDTSEEPPPSPAPVEVRMDTRTPYYGRRMGMPAQPTSGDYRNNPCAVIEGRYNRGIGKGEKVMYVNYIL